MGRICVSSTLVAEEQGLNAIVCSSSVTKLEILRQLLVQNEKVPAQG